jgi:hypothetical protein
MSGADGVGPVLEAGEVASALIAAIREHNREVEVQDRGAYFRVLARGRCVLPRQVVERLLGRAFRLPGDLELVMPSFKGTFSVSEDEAVWEAAAR